jgi:hypothetical protein
VGTTLRPFQQPGILFRLHLSTGTIITVCRLCLHIVMGSVMEREHLRRRSILKVIVRVMYSLVIVIFVVSISQ